MGRVLIWHEGALGDLIISRLAIGALAQRSKDTVLLARSEGRALFEGHLGEILSTDPLAPLFWGKVPAIISGAKRIYLFFHRPPETAISRLVSLGLEIKVVNTRPSGLESAAYYQLSQIGGEPALFTFADWMGSTSRKVIIHPGSGSRYKNYPLEAFLTLARCLKDKGYDVLFVLGPAEDSLREPLLKDGQDVLDRLSLKGLVEILKRARLYIGNDSGVSHLAASLGIPTFVIFGPTDPKIWSPIGPRVKVWRSEACPPCWPSSSSCKERICLQVPPRVLAEEIYRFSTTATEPLLEPED
ncbi:glycosyltransferase family 9 protein [Thermosulfuriphilus sp.]